MTSPFPARVSAPVGRPSKCASATAARSAPVRGPAATPPDCPAPWAFWASCGDREATRTTLRRASIYKTRILWRSQPRVLRTSYSFQAHFLLGYFKGALDASATACDPDQGGAYRRPGIPTRDRPTTSASARRRVGTEGSTPCPQPSLRPAPGTISRTNRPCCPTLH